MKKVFGVGDTVQITVMDKSKADWANTGATKRISVKVVAIRTDEFADGGAMVSMDAGDGSKLHVRALGWVLSEQKESR